MNDVILLNSSITKNGTTVLTYAYKDPNEKYKKGYSVMTQFINVPGLHDKFDSNSFPIKCTADFSYQDTYNGQARKVINMLVDSDGELIFEI